MCCALLLLLSLQCLVPFAVYCLLVVVRSCLRFACFCRLSFVGVVVRYLLFEVVVHIAVGCWLVFAVDVVVVVGVVCCVLLVVWC